MPSSPRVPPPPPTRRAPVVEVLHGVEVADPYRWLEADADPDVEAWIAIQNERTHAALGDLTGRDALHAELSPLLRAGSSVACAVAGDRVFSIDRWGGHDQAVLVVRDAADRHAVRTLVDPHGLTGDATASIDWYQPSNDGRLVAYGISTGGDELSTLHVLDADTGDHRDDAIPHTRAASVAWTPEGDAFVYTRYPDPASVPDDERGYWRKAFRHRLGDRWENDELVWDRLPDKTAWANVSLSRDGRWLLVHLSLGWSRVDVHLVDLGTGARTALIEDVEAISTFDVLEDRVVGITTLDADRGRVVTAPVTAPAHDNWSTIIPESDRVLESFAVTSSSLLVLSSRSAVTSLDRYAFDGTGRMPVELPALGSLVGLSGSRERDEGYFNFTSFAAPPGLYRWTPDAVVEWSQRPGRGPGRGRPTADYVVEQVRYPSNDGTEIPMFLVRAGATTPSATTPCVLTGYGGFSIVNGPAYNPAAVTVCDRGGIYAVANIRGGAEEGESWHRAGMREHKQRSFDDFIAAADWLVAKGYTSRDCLAIRGGSNGGLLMGAAVTQRPDLCRAAHIAVPLLDMVRYQRFLIARLWIPEYGDPDEPEEFAWLWTYSPYHRVLDGTCYPAVLLTTARGDSRVDPMHARKMAARLQVSTSCGDDHPILFREETDAGHGQGKPVTKQAEELADVLGFLLWQLGTGIVRQS